MEDNRTEWQRKCGKRCGFPMRGVIALLAFFGLASFTSQRLSITFVIMMNEPINQTNAQNNHQNCPDDNDNIMDIPRSHNTYHASNFSKSLGSYFHPALFMGYMSTQIPGGVLSDLYGAKWVLCTCILLSSLITLLMPFVINNCKLITICILRMLMGMSQGPIGPSVISLLASWVPKGERATLNTLAYGGVPMGIILTGYTSAYLLVSFTEWEITHYLFGSMGLVCFLLLISAASSHPSNHPCIRPEELVFLNDQIKSYKISLYTIPWKAIMLNKPMISVIFAQLGHKWGYYLMLTGVPNYLKSVLKISLRDNGFVLCLPVMAMFVWINLAGMLADWVIKTGTMEVGTQRKLYTFLATFFLGTFTLFASFAECNIFLVVWFLAMAVITHGFYYSGLRLAPMDLSHSYAGTLVGIVNGIGTLSSFCCPIVTSYMTTDNSIEEWRTVFLLSLLILTITALGFVKWGSADVQPFDPSFLPHGQV